jgi:translation initiation factor 1
MSVICKRCGLPEDLCACSELEKEGSKIVIRLEKRRFNKDTTMIEGIGDTMDLDKIVKYLKSKLACGGTSKDGYILLQGDHREQAKKHLIELGFSESSIEVH